MHAASFCRLYCLLMRYILVTRISAFSENVLKCHFLWRVQKVNNDSFVSLSYSGCDSTAAVSVDWIKDGKGNKVMVVSGPLGNYVQTPKLEMQLRTVVTIIVCVGRIYEL